MSRLAGALAFAALLVCGQAGGVSTADPGVTSSTVLLGGTVLLTARPRRSAPSGATELRVLVENGDLGARSGLHKVLSVNVPFAPVAHE